MASTRLRQTITAGKGEGRCHGVQRNTEELTQGGDSEGPGTLLSADFGSEV